MGTGNRLGTERSPYLRQHADNPVDWMPWGPEAFEAARARDVPIFLSVGYSACHWCHVMAHESFEDDDVATDLNARFVSVKVDREERPDVDSLYMAAVLAANGHGGWPMSVFLTPDGRPFFAGTYFPPSDRHGLPGFRRLLDAVADAWATKRPEVERQADALAAAAAEQVAPEPGALGAVELADVERPEFPGLLDAALAELTSRFGGYWGGFSPAPKFPQPSFIELCLRASRRGHPDALGMAETTLAAMAAGGLHDQVGGGFARYSTDASWTVPHFEKMLYDQSGLLRAYLRAWMVTGHEKWREVVDDIVSYVLRDLSHPGGGLFSAEDADSEGEEGLFYVWTPAELGAVLGEDAADASSYYGLDDGPNFEGRNILRLDPSGFEPRGEKENRWRSALGAARAERVRPALDDKVLTEWNAMFCAALAEAAAATGRADWAEAAESVAVFLLDNLRDDSGRWLRSWRDGHAGQLAFAADYAWLVDAFTRLAELTGKTVWLERATEVGTQLLALFRPDHGPLRTTGEDAEDLLVRPVESLDDATPSATAVAGTALIRLGALTGDDGLAQTGADLLHSLVPLLSQHPLAGAYAVAGLELADEGVTEVVVAGDRPDLVAVARGRYEPVAVLAWGERGQSPLWEGRRDGLAYVCRHRVCLAPAASPEELAARLNEQSTPWAVTGTRP